MLRSMHSRFVFAGGGWEGEEESEYELRRHRAEIRPGGGFRRRLKRRYSTFKNRFAMGTVMSHMMQR